MLTAPQTCHQLQDALWFQEGKNTGGNVCICYYRNAVAVFLKRIRWYYIWIDPQPQSHVRYNFRLPMCPTPNPSQAGGMFVWGWACSPPRQLVWLELHFALLFQSKGEIKERVLTLYTNKQFQIISGYQTPRKVALNYGSSRESFAKSC